MRPKGRPEKAFGQRPVEDRGGSVHRRNVGHGSVRYPRDKRDVWHEWRCNVSLPPGQSPDYIFPDIPGQYANFVTFFQFNNLMWRPLYWFGDGGKPVVNYKLSLGKPPVYSNGGRTVTITLNHYRWSDGKPVTNRDVQLWIEIQKAEPAQFYGYVPGALPDNIVSMDFPSATPYTFSITFNRVYSPLYLLYNNLGLIVPLPQQAWDRTSASTPVGNYDLTSAGAAAVWRYLSAQSESETTWTSNPLWRVVDGPWQLSQFSPSTGAASLVPNQTYTGPERPHLRKVEYVPFTSDSAEYDALRSGGLTYGYLPAQDIDQRSYFQSHGYRILPWTDFGYANIWLNFTNPKDGSIFKQLYIRQAMQRLINQPQIVHDVYHGYAYTTYGPVPVSPASPYSTSYEKTNPYPYSVSAAKHLLQTHGWNVRANGVSTCARAGAGPSDCGQGIVAGTGLSFTMLVGAGSAPFLAENEVIQSDMGKAGIQLVLRTEPVQTLYAATIPCDQTSGAGCSWQISNFAAPSFTATFGPPYLPTMSVWLASGAGANSGAYSNAALDNLFATAPTEPGVSPYNRENEFVASQVPILFEPDYPYQISVVSKKLAGVTPQDPETNIYPEDWRLSQ